LMYAAGDVDGLANSRAGFSTTWHRRGDPVATTRQLIDWGLDPAAANARGRTPLRLAVNAGNLDVAAVLAEALAAQGKLGAAEVRLFKGTEYQARVAALTTSVQPKKPAKPKKPIKPKASEDVVQRATWDRALALIDGPTDWQPSQYPEWLRTCLKEVIARLASGADPRVPPDVLYLEYHGHFRSLRWSRTKSYVSRSGAVELEAQVFDWAKMSVSFSQVDNDNWVLREAIELPMEPPGTPPSTEALCDAVGQLCARYLKTVG
jgi:ankyrin repeat protein